MSFLRLASALKTIAQKSSHPSDLIYKIQLARVKSQQLDRGEIGDGKVGVVELAAPPGKLKGEQEAEDEGSRGGVDGERTGLEEQELESSGRGKIEAKDIDEK